MKCLVLAAGYATRLYPLTKNFPKPLLKVRERTILDWLLSDVEQTAEVSEFIVVTNHRFYEQFQQWQASCELQTPIRILDDGSTENENRLGAVKDIVLAIETLGIDEDLMVLAGDNVLDFSLGGFASFFRAKGHTCVMRYEEPELARLQKTGVAVVDAEDRIVEMQEKPKEPKSCWAVPPFYIYSREDLSWIQKGIAAGCGTDAPGSFITWLCGQKQVYAYEMPGKRFDIGDQKSYEEVQEQYPGIVRKE